jgi:hypothetical protein
MDMALCKRRTLALALKVEFVSVTLAMVVEFGAECEVKRFTMPCLPPFGRCFADIQKYLVMVVPT